MTPRWQAIAPAIFLIGSLTGAAPRLAGQDSLLPQPDSIASPEDRPLVRVEIATVRPQVPIGPLGVGTRYTFTRDSLYWSNAATLSDLLSGIPGVYVARGGFLGLPEYVVYGGRGARSVEVYWDGFVLEPLGSDSIFADPARIPLTLIRRIDVEVLPSTLRVYLVSERHETLESRSLVRVRSGDFGTGAYAGLFQKRWTSGFGIDLGGDFVSTDGASGPNRTDQTFDVWAKLTWVPRAGTGAVYQIRRQAQDRDPVLTSAGDVGIAARNGTRTDSFLQIFTSGPDPTRGVSAMLGLGASAWTNDSVTGEQHFRQAFGRLRFSRPTLNLEVTGLVADDRILGDAGARVGWIPVRGIALSGEGRIRRHSNQRSSREARGTASLYWGPATLVGELALYDHVEAPVIPDDTSQSGTDRGVHFHLRSRPLSGRIGIVRRDAFTPRPFPDLTPVLPAAGTSTQATYLITSVKFQPVSALILDGWYSNPVRGSAAFQPPSHGRAQFTFRSKFWRSFRSGVFDLKVQLAMESWSRGRAGSDAAGLPIELRGVTFYEAFLQVQLVGFTLFWDLRNAYNAREQYVPGLAYPRNAQTFGVRWTFYN